eukprot:7378427-Prymnesium_polylepis.2
MAASNRVTLAPVISIVPPDSEECPLARVSASSRRVAPLCTSNTRQVCWASRVAPLPSEIISKRIGPTTIGTPSVSMVPEAGGGRNVWWRRRWRMRGRERRGRGWVCQNTAWNVGARDQAGGRAERPQWCVVTKWVSEDWATEIGCQPRAKRCHGPRRARGAYTAIALCSDGHRDRTRRAADTRPDCGEGVRQISACAAA